ncbi:hypothetical protein ACRQ1B_07710 [Rhizobium panacihumi]
MNKEFSFGLSVPCCKYAATQRNCIVKTGSKQAEINPNAAGAPIDHRSAA